jgi:hypothetical protein
MFATKPIDIPLKVWPAAREGNLLELEHGHGRGGGLEKCSNCTVRAFLKGMKKCIVEMFLQHFVGNF